MTKFYYRAKDWTGKTIKGVLDQADRMSTIESIKSIGLVPLDVAEYQENVVSEMFRKITSRVSIKDVAVLTRQLSTMMTAGLPLTDALNLLKVQFEGSPSKYEILDSCLVSVRGGQPLGKALERYSKVFGDAYIASIKAGEEGGVLQEVLQKLAVNLEGESDFRSKVKWAMVYPIIVIVGMMAVAIIMMIFVFPKLVGLYADFGTAQMPLPTRVLMSMSDYATKFWFLIPITIIAVAAVMRAGEGSHEFRLQRDSMMLKLPVFGTLSTKTILANTMRTMSMMLTAGISLVESLRIVSKVAGNEVYQVAFDKIAERVQKGFSIASSFEETGMFPPIVNQMVSTGEATGKLDEVLMRVSDYFSEEAEQAVKGLTSAIEPLIIIVLGVGVAFLVIAVIMPIYNLTASF